MLAYDACARARCRKEFERYVVDKIGRLKQDAAMAPTKKRIAQQLKKELAASTLTVARVADLVMQTTFHSSKGKGKQGKGKGKASGITIV